jgi:hypothetical protein
MISQDSSQPAGVVGNHLITTSGGTLLSKQKPGIGPVKSSVSYWAKLNFSAALASRRLRSNSDSRKAAIAELASPVFL